MDVRAKSIRVHGAAVDDDIALQRIRQRVRQLQTRNAEATQSLSAQIVASSTSAERLRSAIENGATKYLIVSDDGNVAVRVRLALDSVQMAEERLGESDVVVDWSRGTVSNGESRVRLSRTELRLFAALVDQTAAPILRRSELAARVWPGAPATEEKENGLPVYICGLRKRLATIGLRSALQTVRGVGYRLVL